MTSETQTQSTEVAVDDGICDIALSNSGIAVEGKAVSNVEKDGVYIANDVIFYEDGKDFTYGEGSAEGAHSSQQALEHTVVHITQARE